MKPVRACAALGLACALACARAGGGTAPADAGGQEGDRLLVMVALAPAHYRPDAAYSGGYDASVGQRSRTRLAGQIAREHGLTVLDSWPMPALGVDCFVMQVARGTSAQAKAAEVAGDRRVESAQSLQAFRGLAHRDPLYSAQPAAMLWHLDELHAVATGRGVRVAVIDTGLDASHPDLAGQVRVERNFVDASDYAPEVHGTEVAGVIAALADNGVGIVGVAPDAAILALRACWQQSAEPARCDSFTLAKALQFAVEARAPIVNLSVTGPPDVLLGRLLDAAWASGMTVVAAADPAANDGGFPARHPHVLSVGELEQEPSARDGAAFLAPGRGIPTTHPSGSWEFVDGSSFAAAHVSGLAALLLEIDPRLPASRVPELLRGARVEVGARPAGAATRIDACSALERLRGGRVCGAAHARAAFSQP